MAEKKQEQGKEQQSTLSSQLPLGSREQLQAGDYAPEGLRGGPPPPDAPGPSPVAPSAKTVAAGGIPSAHPAHGFDAPDGDKSI